MTRTKQVLAFSFAAALFGAGCQAGPAVPAAQAPTPAPERPDVTEQTVATGTLRGLYVVPAKRTGKVPGIVIVHEWWGLNDQIKDEARQLAAQGYAVFAIDLYDGQVTDDATQAGKLSGAVRAAPDAALKKMNAAVDFLAAQPEVESQKLATIGWCFGGGFSALEGTTGDPRLKATVVYYGTPITDPKQLARMKQPVLGIWGEDDQAIPAAGARIWEAALKKQGTSAEFHYYPGAGHAFANPTHSDSYRPEATADAWAKTLAFLATNLKK